MCTSLTLFLLVVLSAARTAQEAGSAQGEGARSGAPQAAPAKAELPALDRASAEARAAWQRLCQATASSAQGPITAFRLNAEVLTRSGVQTNETRIDYRYLAPDCIRFILPSHNETGRFGPAQDQYWMRSGKEVIVLAGREYEVDRRQVDDMLALSKNYVALSDPARMNLAALEKMPAGPADLGELAKNARKLDWFALESPDFALVRRDGAGGAGTLYRVEIGLRESGVPGMAVIRSKSRAGGDPLLVEFDKYQEKDGFQIPFTLLVHVLDTSLAPPAFAQDASQEVYVTEANLKPKLSVKDFQP